MSRSTISPRAARPTLAAILTRAALRSSRTTQVAVAAVLATTALGATTATSAAVALTATPALIMGGTGMPTPTPAYLAGAVDNFITPALGGSYAAVATYTPEEGLGTLPGETMSILESAKAGIPYLEAEMAKYPGEPLVVFGYSQSGAIAIQVKKKLAAYADANPDAPVPEVTFVIIGTGARPNGSLQYRLGSAYNTSIIDERTRLDTPFKTIDVAMQYDIASDAPLYPINLLADLNWLLGGLYVHNDYLPLQPPYDQYNTPDRPTLEGLQGVTKPGIDTTFYFIPTENLPLFGPLRSLGVPEALIDIVEPLTRVIVEWGYDRTIAPWTPTPFRLVPRVNPITATVDVINAIGEGITNALKAIGITIKPASTSDVIPSSSATAVSSASVADSASSAPTESSRSAAETGNAVAVTKAPVSVEVSAEPSTSPDEATEATSPTSIAVPLSSPSSPTAESAQTPSRDVTSSVAPTPEPASEPAPSTGASTPKSTSSDEATPGDAKQSAAPMTHEATRTAERTRTLEHPAAPGGPPTSTTPVHTHGSAPNVTGETATPSSRLANAARSAERGSAPSSASSTPDDDGTSQPR